MLAYCSSCGSKTESRTIGRQELSVCPDCDHIFFRNPKVVAAAVIEDTGRVLLVRRDIEPGRGLWGLPGGFVDWDEHPEEAMVRECREEVGVQVEPIELLTVLHIRQAEEGIVGLYYRARVISGEATALDEAQEVAWFTPDRLPPLAFATHRNILRRWSEEVLARGAA